MLWSKLCYRPSMCYRLSMCGWQCGATSAGMQPLACLRFVCAIHLTGHLRWQACLGGRAVSHRLHLHTAWHSPAQHGSVRTCATGGADRSPQAATGGGRPQPAHALQGKADRNLHMRRRGRQTAACTCAAGGGRPQPASCHMGRQTADCTCAAGGGRPQPAHAPQGGADRSLHMRRWGGQTAACGLHLKDICSSMQPVCHVREGMQTHSQCMCGRSFTGLVENKMTAHRWVCIAGGTDGQRCTNGQESMQGTWMSKNGAWCTHDSAIVTWMSKNGAWCTHDSAIVTHG